MAEVGLVEFATVALRVGQAALPAHRSKFSKRQFSQPQMLAILCLMRYGTGHSEKPKSAWLNTAICG
jgi:hypothetical protein